MAKSSAQRQAEYRERHLQAVTASDERLSVIVDVHAKRALERLASCYGVTQRAMLEQLITQAQSATLDQFTPAEQNNYYDGKIRLAVTA